MNIGTPSILGTQCYNMVNTDDLITNKLTGDYLIIISKWKGTITCATTTNIVLSGIQTIDDVELEQSDTVLVKNQNNPIENGIYQVYNENWKRYGLLTGKSMDNVACYIKSGTTNKTQIFVCVSLGIVGQDNVQFVGAAGVFNLPNDPSPPNGALQYGKLDIINPQEIYLTFGGIEQLKYTEDKELLMVPNIGGFSRYTCLEAETTIESTEPTIVYTNPTLQVYSSGLIGTITNGNSLHGNNNTVQYNNNGSFFSDNTFTYSNETITVENINVDTVNVSEGISFPPLVTPGTYNNTDLTINNKGIITSISNGTGYVASLQYNNSNTLNGTSDILLSNNTITSIFGTLGITKSGTSNFSNGSKTITHDSTTTNYMVILNTQGHVIITNKSLLSFTVTSYTDNGSIDFSDTSEFEWFLIYSIN